MTHTILMGDPTHFSVVGGANPHTRDRYGRRKSVDRALAIKQWERMRDLLTDHGLRVVVVPPDPELPGLVYPANAGFRHGDQFVLSNLTPTRAGEKDAYRTVIQELGLRTSLREILAQLGALVVRVVGEGVAGVAQAIEVPISL